jgi:hypothetical protein
MTLHHAIVRETPGFDYGEVRRRDPDRYAKIKDIENSIDSLGDARLSRVIALLTRWRELVLMGWDAEL